MVLVAFNTYWSSHVSFGQVLEPSMLYKQKIPVRCKLRTSRKQPNGKIFDLVTPKPSNALWFLHQHCSGQKHQQMLHLRNADARLALEDRDAPACEGLSLLDEKSGPLHGLREHFKLWMAWHPNSELSKHSYNFVQSSGSYILVHANCAKKAEPVAGRRNMCSECASLNELRKVVVRTTLKKFGAELLFQYLFGTEDSAKQLKLQIQEDVIYQRYQEPTEAIMNYEPFQLQQWVRQSFMSVRQDMRTAVYASFLESTVRPAITTNVVALKKIKPGLMQAQLHLEKFLANPNASDVDRIHAIIAQSSLSGRLDAHPLLQGMTLTCLRMLERAEGGHEGRGLTTGRIGHNSAMHSEAARELALEAGRRLCLASGNKRLLSRFGCAQKPFAGGCMKMLKEAGLPVPFNSISSEEQLADNLRLADQQMSAVSATSGRASDQVSIWFVHVRPRCPMSQFTPA